MSPAPLAGFIRRHRRTAARAGLLVALGASVGCRATTAPAPADPLGQFDGFWAALDKDYPYFAFKQIDWDSMRAAYRPLAETAPTTDSLVTLLRAMTSPLRDVHLSFTSPTGAFVPSWTPPARRNWDLTRWQGAVAAHAWVQRKPNLGTAAFDDVGYLAIGAWNGANFSVTDLDDALAAVRDRRALIIDVRANGGGNDALAFAFAARLSTTTIAAGSVRYRSGAGLGSAQARTIAPRGPWAFTKPIVLLVGRGCYSSNESFIAALATLPHVTVMGDTTGGGSGNPAEHALGGGWRYRVPRWIEYAPDGRIIEWNGLVPDVVVPWDTTGLAPTRDPVLEAAVAYLAPPGSAEGGAHLRAAGIRER